MIYNYSTRNIFIHWYYGIWLVQMDHYISYNLFWVTTNLSAQHVYCELKNNNFFIIFVSSLRLQWGWRTDRQKSSMACLGTCWAPCPFRQASSLKWAPVTRPSSNTSSRRSRWGSRRCFPLVRLHYLMLSIKLCYLVLHYILVYVIINYSLIVHL